MLELESYLHTIKQYLWLQGHVIEGRELSYLLRHKYAVFSITGLYHNNIIPVRHVVIFHILTVN